MSASNTTSTHPEVFILMGIPGLEHLHNWISIPFCTAYTLALLGNCTLLFIIQADAALHEPMYLFLAMLAAIDLVLSSTTLPKMLAIFWFRDREINFYACLVQMFFLHSFSIMESAVLLAMAFDRYVAICKPLHYTTVLTGSLITKVGMAAVTRAVALMTPLPFLLRPFYTPVVISSVMHRVARQAAPHVHILFANFYMLFPPMINPIIYGVKTKQIRERVLGLLLRKDV
ncbi:olfactory receptor 52K1 [Suricata suricatta]|uniref:olfactory receptor 52K1 n=1 Tax=Suricata suricatta TaxID=37032 RepID=UPI0011566E11|nr:olfactory receptor 52K1 [Suricata suricatta]